MLVDSQFTFSYSLVQDGLGSNPDSYIGIDIQPGALDVSNISCTYLPIRNFNYVLLYLFNH